MMLSVTTLSKICLSVSSALLGLLSSAMGYSSRTAQDRAPSTRLSTGSASVPSMSERSYPTAEHRRMAEDRDRIVRWRQWGPYLSDRAWGTVREDYSASGDAWGYFPHDHGRSRAYRWSEDGL